MAKRLYRTHSGKKIAGVCNGLAEYFDIDPVIIRLAWVLAILCLGTGLIAYIVAIIVIPSDKDKLIEQ